jgi:hypothetical protein
MEVSMKLTKQVKKALAALAYADASEFMSGAEKERALRGRGESDDAAQPRRQPAPAPCAAVPSIQIQIGLYVGATLDQPVVRYVADSCKRLNAVLTIVTFQSKEATRALLAPYQAELGRDGVAWRIVCLSGEPRQALERYLRRESRMAFLACSESGFLGHIVLADGRRPDLGLPLVVVAGKGIGDHHDVSERHVARA